MTYTDLNYDVDGHVATITLNRPERLNAISGGMLASFLQAFREADRDRKVRAIILTGAGKGFCSGLDLKEQGANANANSINGAGGLPSKFDLADSPPMVLHTTDKPVICALNGAAAGYTWTSRWAATSVSPPSTASWPPSSPSAVCCLKAAVPGCCPGLSVGRKRPRSPSPDACSTPSSASNLAS